MNKKAFGVFIILLLVFSFIVPIDAYADNPVSKKRIAAGNSYSLALKSDGTVVAWGGGAAATVPSGLTGVVAIAGGNNHSLALQSDGTVFAWGSNLFKQLNVPSGLNNVVAIAAGNGHSLALKSDGTVVAWGDNTYGQCTVPSGLTGVAAIAAGQNHSLALKSDGTVAAWGRNTSGQCTVPSGLNNVVVIAAGQNHSLALKSDGTVVAWGSVKPATVPSGLTGVVAIAAGQNHSLALKSDGTVVVWGNGSGATVPSGLTGVVAIATGNSHSLALKSDGTVTAWGDNSSGQCDVPSGLNLATWSFDAILGSIILSSGPLSPAFDPDTTSYTASVPYAVNSLTVTPTAGDANVTITVNGTPVASGQASDPISLDVGDNTVTIQVTAQDGATRTYTVVVTRTEAVATLSNLTISSGELSPAFDLHTLSYTASVVNNVYSLTVTPTAGDANVTITVNGTPVASGQASDPISLDVGDNTVTIQVTAQDGATRTYTVVVTRTEAAADTTLSNLTISSGELSPAFDPGTTSYTASVVHSVYSLTVTPTANESHATITVNGTPVTSGQASQAISLDVGDNTVTIQVTAQDATTRAYTVVVTRAAVAANLRAVGFYYAMPTNDSYAEQGQSYFGLITADQLVIKDKNTGAVQSPVEAPTRVSSPSTTGPYVDVKKLAYSLAPGNYVFEGRMLGGAFCGSGEFVVEENAGAAQEFYLMRMVMATELGDYGGLGSDMTLYDYLGNPLEPYSTTYHHGIPDEGATSQYYLIIARPSDKAYSCVVLPKNPAYAPADEDFSFSPAANKIAITYASVSTVGSNNYKEIHLLLNVVTPFYVSKGADLHVYYRKGGLYYTPFVEYSQESVDKESNDAYDIYMFRVPTNLTLHYEAGGGAYLKECQCFMRRDDADQDFSVTINLQPLTNERRDNSFMDADLYLNTPDSRAVELAEGGTFDLYPLRVWQAVLGVTGNYFTEPDYHFEVIDPQTGEAATLDSLAGGSVEKGPIALAPSGRRGRETYRITGIRPGLALIRITYDAIGWRNDAGQRRQGFANTDSTLNYFNPIEERTAALVAVNVGGPDSSGITTNIGQREYDTIYIDRTIGHADYTFAPESSLGDISVRVHDPLQNTAWGEGWHDYGTKASGESFTIQLKDGRNLVEVRSGGAAKYHVIYAKAIDITVRNMSNPNWKPGEPLAAGGTVSVSFDGLKTPVQKLAGIYNPGYPENWENPGPPTVYVDYQTSAGGHVESNHTQYGIGLTTTLSLTITEPGETVLTNGRIHCEWYGDPLDSHRNIPETGRSANTNAGYHKERPWHSTLPDITLFTAGEEEGETAAVTFTGQEEGASLVVKSYKGFTKTPDENGVYTLPVGGGHKYYYSKPGYLTRAGTFAVGADGATIALPAFAEGDRLPQTTGAATVTVIAQDCILRNSQAVSYDIASVPDLAHKGYVEYNHGGYTVLHAILKALDAGGVDFTCNNGVLTPQVTTSGSPGAEAGWLCEVDGVTVADYANTLTGDGDVIVFYYNADTSEPMLHAWFEEPAVTAPRDGGATLTLRAIPAGNTNPARTPEPVAGASVYLAGREWGQTDANGQITLNSLGGLSLGTYTVTAHKKNAGGNETLTYVRALLTVTRTGIVPTPEDNITVTFRLVGDTVDQDGKAHFGGYVNWIKTTTYTLQKGSKVYDLFTRALADAGLSQTGADDNYVETIYAPSVLGGYALSEFTNGLNSGWMYTVNGSHPSAGLRDYTLSDGDEVIWHYVNDYTLETSSFGAVSRYVNPWLDARDVSPEGGAPDTTPPAFAEGYPRADNLTATGCDLLVKLDEPGAAYYKLVADGAEPGSEYLDWTPLDIPGTDTVTASVYGLAPGAPYDLYVIARDTAGNLQATPVKLDVTTPSQTVHVAGVTLDRESLTLTTGGGATLVATVTPPDATDQAVTWSSDNEAVATVDQNGAVTGLAPGSATITVTTTDGGHTDTCAVTVTGESPSPDAALSNLTLSSGTLIPAFTPGATSYTASVVNNVYSLTVTPTAGDANVTITVNGTPVASGQASDPISLAVGPNTVTIVVTAQDGATNTYTVVVTRVGAKPTVTGVTNPPDINVAYGTVISGVNLPSTVSVTLSDGSTVSASVTWDTLSYDGNTSGTYTLAGTLSTLPEGATNPDNLKASIQVIVGDKPSSAVTITSVGGSGVSNYVTSTTGSASVTPSAGGSISLGSEAKLSIPPGALKGTDALNVTIKEASDPPAPPEGYAVIGAYSFTVGGQESYTFNKPVTLTFTFDPAAIPEGQTPAVYYYNGTEWVLLTGTVSGHTITVTLDHFTTFAVLARAAKEATPPPVPAPTFSDVPSSFWAYDVITSLAGQNYIAGYPDGTFKPDSTITRAEFATLLVKALGLPQPTEAQAQFRDVPTDAWFHTSVAAAAYAGLVNGLGDGTFAPNALITREQMAVIIVRALENTGYATSGDAQALDKFGDRNSIDDWALQGLAKAVNAGVVRGMSATAIAPLEHATRAQAAAMIQTLLKLTGKR